MRRLLLQIRASVWVKIKRQGTAGSGGGFNLAGSHVGYLSFDLHGAALPSCFFLPPSALGQTSAPPREN